MRGQSRTTLQLAQRSDDPVRKRLEKKLPDSRLLDADLVADRILDPVFLVFRKGVGEVIKAMLPQLPGFPEHFVPHFPSTSSGSASVACVGHAAAVEAPGC